MLNLIKALFIQPDKAISLDQLQLTAAQDRLKERSDTLNEQVDEFTRMMRRIKRTQSKGRQK